MGPEFAATEHYELKTTTGEGSELRYMLLLFQKYQLPAQPGFQTIFPAVQIWQTHPQGFTMQSKEKLEFNAVSVYNYFQLNMRAEIL